MTNREYINSLSDKEFAKSRIRTFLDVTCYRCRWAGDFDGIVLDEETAIRKEIEWLNQEFEQ